MTEIPDNLKSSLGPLAFMLGGYDAVKQLPVNTIINALSHGDGVVGVSNKSYIFELTDIDGNYEVFNRRLESRYIGTPDADKMWGTTEVDQVFLAQLDPGTYFYIAYNNINNVERLILVVRA